MAEGELIDEAAKLADQEASGPLAACRIHPRKARPELGNLLVYFSEELTMGRPKGSLNKRSKALIRMDGEMPAEYMLRVMRDTSQPVERRDEMAKAAAPYFHAKLQSIQHGGEITTSKVIRTPEIQTNLDAWQKQYADQPEKLN